MFPLRIFPRIGFSLAVLFMLAPIALQAQKADSAATEAKCRHNWYLSSNVGPVLGLVVRAYQYYSVYDIQFYHEPVLAKGEKGWRLRAGLSLGGTAGNHHAQDDTNSTFDSHSSQWQMQGILALERVWQMQAPIRFGLGPIIGPAFEHTKSTSTTTYNSAYQNSGNNTGTRNSPGLYAGLIGSLNWQANSWLMIGGDAQLVLLASHEYSVSKNTYSGPDNPNSYTNTRRDRYNTLNLNYSPLWRISASILLK